MDNICICNYIILGLKIFSSSTSSTFINFERFVSWDVITLMYITSLLFALISIFAHLIFHPILVTRVLPTCTNSYRVRPPNMRLRKACHRSADCDADPLINAYFSFAAGVWPYSCCRCYYITVVWFMLLNLEAPSIFTRKLLGC